MDVPPTLRKHPIGFLGGSGVWKKKYSVPSSMLAASISRLFLIINFVPVVRGLSDGLANHLPPQTNAAGIPAQLQRLRLRP